MNDGNHRIGLVQLEAYFILNSEAEEKRFSLFVIGSVRNNIIHGI